MIRICPLLKDNNICLFESVLKTGFNAVRFNFSHVEPDIAYLYKTFLDKYFPHIIKIQDLQGHKIRIGNIDTTFIEPNESFLIIPEGYTNENYAYKQIPISFENYELLKDTKYFVVENKNNIAKISVIETITEKNIILFHCKSDNKIVLRKEKGINAIGFDRTKLKLSIKDKKDILWGLENHIDIIINSFTSSSEQLIELKDYIKQNSDYTPKIWAKIENQEGIDNIEEILSVCDGIMIGRGDLSIEIPIVNIPEIQNYLINICKEKNKECIIATHIYDNFSNKNIDNISDITSLYYLYKNGATGFMPANEIIFSKDAQKIAKHFNNYINSLEK